MKQAKTRLVAEGILPEVKGERLYKMNVDFFPEDGEYLLMNT